MKHVCVIYEAYVLMESIKVISHFLFINYTIMNK